MTYTVKNKDHDQDNINFIDFDPTNPKEEMPSFLDYQEVLNFSIKNGFIEDETQIMSLCDGGDHLEPYFSPLPAFEECEIYVRFNK